MNRNDQLISWLNNAYAMENSMTQVLESHSSSAKNNIEMYSRLQAHLNETKIHAERLRECIHNLGGAVSAGKSIFGEIAGTMEGVATAGFKDEQLKNLLIDYSAEHFEIACYRSLIHAADIVGADNVVSVARQTLAEEQRMADWLLAQIPPVTAKMLQMETALACGEFGCVGFP